MKKYLITILFASCLMFTTSAQNKSNYPDVFLTSSFKVFQSADFEMAYHLLPFLRKRFVKELKDTSSFYNPYDSLSKYIGIRYSSDSLLKTYCWSERNGSCCHTSATFAQFKTGSGKIKFADLEDDGHEGQEIFITDLQMIEIGNTPHYLILGWGSCCGGKHFGLARIYEITRDTLVQSQTLFDSEDEIYVGANRSQEIGLEYSPELKTLSYSSYPFDEETGFYKKEKTIVEWKLKKKGFKRID